MIQSKERPHGRGLANYQLTTTNYQLLRNFYCVFAINDTCIHETAIH